RAAFFDERVPREVVSGRHFDRWWRQARPTEPALLDYPMDMLIEGEVAADGVTVHIPLASLGAVRNEGFEWLVPAFRSELVIALLRSLPKRLRTPLVPI